MRDPVPVRSGLYIGDRGDTVALQIDGKVLERAKNEKSRHAAMADPGEKPGLVGAFNRVFQPKDLAYLMPDDFVQGRDEKRFTAIGHASPDGVFITACGHGLVNTHGTAPEGADRRQNIFDFIRLHMFGSLDDGIAHDVPIAQRPSHRAMLDYVKKHFPEVVEECERFERENATQVFAQLEDNYDGTLTEETGGILATAPTGALVPPRPELEAAESSQGGAPKGLPALTDAIRNPRVAGRLIAFDSFAGRLMWAPPDAHPPQWRDFTDNDFTRLRDRLGRHFGFKKVGVEDLRHVVEMVAEENQFDTAQIWLSGRKWDGKPRVETSLERHFGAPPGDYSQAVSRYLWTALAGRVLDPGVKADMVPIAVGKQGCGKSSTIAALVPDSRFFAELDLQIRDDDAKRQLQGKLVVELPELRGFGSRDADSLKAFISSREDEWVEKYKTQTQKRPRRFVFVGSTNRDEFLADETGNRRFLPFRAGACTADLLIQEREQLWAEAAVLFQRNGVMYKDAEQLAREEHTAYIQTDPMDDKVQQWLESARAPAPKGVDEDHDELDSLADSHLRREFVTSLEVMMDAMGFTQAQCSKSQEMRVGRILRRLGWVRCQRKIEGRTCSGWTRGT